MTLDDLDNLINLCGGRENAGGHVVLAMLTEAETLKLDEYMNTHRNVGVGSLAWYTLKRAKVAELFTARGET